MASEWSNWASTYGYGTTSCSASPNFPIIESLTLLTAIAARTSKIKLGTGILECYRAQSVILAKQLACMDLLSDGRLLMGMASNGWYRREFNAIGVPFEQRGKIMDENLDILKRFWTEPMVSGKFATTTFPPASCIPQAVQKPYPPILIGGYVADPPTRGGRGRRLAHLLLPAESREILGQDSQFREGRRQGPGQAPQRLATADLHRQVAAGG